jgi:hypothetical protein
MGNAHGILRNAQANCQINAHGILRQVQMSIVQNTPEQHFGYEPEFPMHNITHT